jgi:ferritin
MIEDVIGDGLYCRLFDQAERVRWRFDDIAWDRIEHDCVTPGLVALVREIAFSELTTMTATRRFLTELSDDVDFTQWIAVWFYEETKHPQALLRWLKQVGVTVNADFIRRGRATAPFMKSRMGTFVTNIISEMVASSAYTSLARNSPEPVLAVLAQHLAADEARHAASFFAYGRRQLETSRDVEADRRDALKVLFVWFQDNDHVKHPVNEFYSRNEARPEVGATMDTLEFSRAAPRERMFRLIGELIGIPLDGSSDLVAALGEAPHETT